MSYSRELCSEQSNIKDRRKILLNSFNPYLVALLETQVGATTAARVNVSFSRIGNILGGSWSLEIFSVVMVYFY